MSPCWIFIFHKIVSSLLLFPLTNVIEGNLIGPQTFRASQAPAYTGGFIAMLICYCICVALMGLYWVLVLKYNRRLANIDPDSQVTNEDLTEAFADRTDFQQTNFRYTT